MYLIGLNMAFPPSSKLKTSLSWVPRISSSERNHTHAIKEFFLAVNIENFTGNI